jgi:hypothetical protein
VNESEAQQSAVVSQTDVGHGGKSAGGGSRATASLRSVDANQVPCLEKPELLLAAEGAPVVFSTDYAHNMVLHVTDKAGRALDLPATADAARGGFLIANRSVAADNWKAR